jgi:hypothetical protein
MQPEPAESPDPGVRPVTEADLDVVEELSCRFYKVSRRNEVGSAIGSPFAYDLREREGRVVGYYAQGLLGHGVAETEGDLLVMVEPMNLMARGPYERPEGVWVPSVMF